MTNIKLTGALALAGRGIPVFPCEVGGKAPLGEAAPHGFKDATTDIEHVRWWWTRYPNANVGMPTGHPGYDVFDVDVKTSGSGWAAFNALKRAGLLPEPLIVVRTPSGGLHAYYVGTEQRCASLKRHYIDFKAADGYVIVPPSVVDGRPYEIIREQPHGDMLNWSAVREFLDPPQPINPVRPRAINPVNGNGIPGLAAWLARQGEGNRNASLYWSCCRALENGASEHDLDELVTIAKSIGLDEREALRTVRSALRTIRRSA